MHPFFASLNVYETALLLTTLTVGGSEQVSLFGHLPEAARRRLVDRADALKAIPAESRVPLMVRELKELLVQGGRRGIERVDPSWIVNGLKGETPRLVGAVLIGLPPPLVRSILKRLPQAVRKSLPPKQQLRQIPPQVQSGIRLFFERRFFPMPERSQGPMQLQDIPHLERIELQALTRDLGLIELGQAFAAVGKIALVELCRRLPDAAAQELIMAVRTASQSGDVPDPRTAQRFLSRVVVNFEDTEEFLQKAGLWRLAKAFSALEPVYQRALAQRLPRHAGQLLVSYVAKVEAMGDITAESIALLQDTVLVRIILMSREQLLSPTWASTAMQFNNAEVSQGALAPKPEASEVPRSKAKPKAPD